MKSSTYILLCLFIFIVNKTSLSQDFWEELDFPYNVNIYCVEISNEGTIFVGAGYDGDPGGVYRSVDNAQTWELVLDAESFSVQSIDINQNGNIYVGKTSTERLNVSYDNGDSWEEIVLPSSSQGNIVKINCYGQDSIYISSWEDFGPVLLFTDNRGSSWDNILYLENHFGEFASDIIVLNSGQIYIGMKAYLPDLGGVYLTEDSGITWELTGLFNHLVTSLEINNNNDVFAGIWGGEQGASAGLFVLRDGENEWSELILGPQIDDLVINGEGHIYFSSSSPNGVVRSIDNGVTFELVNEGLIGGPMGYITIDNLGFLYVTSLWGSHFLAKSINPTVSIPEANEKSHSKLVTLFPNPTEDLLNIRSSCNNDFCEKYNVAIFNISGNLVIIKEVYSYSGQVQIGVRELKSGIYFINISQENYSITEKFIKN